MNIVICECCESYPAIFAHPDTGWPSLCHSCQRHKNHGQEECPYKDIPPGVMRPDLYPEALAREETQEE